MAEPENDSDVFEHAEKAIDDASVAAARLADRFDALRKRARQAAGAGLDGQVYMETFNPAADAAMQRIQAIVDALSAAKENLQAAQDPGLPPVPGHPADR